MWMKYERQKFGRKEIKSQVIYTNRTKLSAKLHNLGGIKPVMLLTGGQRNNHYAVQLEKSSDWKLNWYLEHSSLWDPHPNYLVCNPDTIAWPRNPLHCPMDQSSIQTSNAQFITQTIVAWPHYPQPHGLKSNQNPHRSVCNPEAQSVTQTIDGAVGVGIPQWHRFQVFKASVHFQGWTFA